MREVNKSEMKFNSSKSTAPLNNLKNFGEIDQFDSSKKIYVTGSREDIKVPMRSINQTFTKGQVGAT